MAHTAPPGYDSNHSALLDLIRFGPAIWSCAQLMALLFHAERSTAYGKDADKHSEDQALEGIYSTRNFAWIRGPAGMGRTAWYKANSELSINDESPGSTPEAVLRKRRSGPGRGLVVEYEIDWLAVKARIAKWKEQRAHFTGQQPQEGSEFRTLPEQEGSTIRTLKGPQFGPFPENAGVENKGSEQKEGSEIRTHSQSLDYKSDLDSPSENHFRSTINLELELASGERVRTDGPSDLILEANAKYRLPLAVVIRFLHDKAGDFRAKGYGFNPQLLAKAFTEDLIPWRRKNQRYIDEQLRRREIERSRVADVKQLESPEAKKEQRPANPKFREELLADIAAKRKLR